MCKAFVFIDPTGAAAMPAPARFVPAGPSAPGVTRHGE